MTTSIPTVILSFWLAVNGVPQWVEQGRYATPEACSRAARSATKNNPTQNPPVWRCIYAQQQ